MESILDRNGHSATGFRRILVGYDFTANSIAAVQKAVRLVQEDGEILVVHAGGGESVREAGEDYLLDHVRQSGVKLEARKHAMIVRSGHPVDVIPKLAVSRECDLVMIGQNQHRDLFGRADLEITTTVSQLAKVPILLVGSSDEIGYRRVLVAVDFSKSAESLVRFVTGRFAEAEIEILHVVDFRPSRRALQQTFQSSLKKSRLAWLHGICSATQSASSRDSRRLESVLMEGHAATVIDAQAKWRKADLIVMGTANPGILKRAMMGSVARAIAKDPPCDALLIPPQ